MKKILILLVLMVLISGCVNQGGVSMNEKTVKNGNRIAVDYVGTLKDGTLFDTSIAEKARDGGKYIEGRPYQPLEFTVGEGQMIKGFDAAVVGMRIGETKTVTLSPEDAYGNPKPELIKTVPIEQLKNAGIEPKEGMTISVGGNPARITKVEDSNVTVDMNHELAGKTLLFEITVREIDR